GGKPGQQTKSDQRRTAELKTRRQGSGDRRAQQRHVVLVGEQQDCRIPTGNLALAGFPEDAGDAEPEDELQQGQREQFEAGAQAIDQTSHRSTRYLGRHGGNHGKILLHFCASEEDDARVKPTTRPSANRRRSPCAESNAGSQASAASIAASRVRPLAKAARSAKSPASNPRKTTSSPN